MRQLIERLGIVMMWFVSLDMFTAAFITMRTDHTNTLISVGIFVIGGLLYITTAKDN